MLDYSERVRLGYVDPEDYDPAPVCEIRQVGDVFQVYEECGDMPMFAVTFASLGLAVEAAEDEGWDVALTTAQRTALYGGEDEDIQNGDVPF